MIQIYKPSNTNYSENGDMTLLPQKASVHVALNGAWQAEIEHPIDREGRWKYIQDESVLKMPSFNGEQLFRIKKKKKDSKGITATAVPIFMDSGNDCYLKDVRPTNVDGQQALNQMLAANSKYSGESDIRLKTTAYYQNQNFIQALNGGEDNSFTNRWGGEILYDNFHVSVNQRAGGDYGVQILYGKNIEKDGISEEIDFQSVATRIYPKSYNGHALSGTGYVNSPVISSYPTVKCSTMVFDDVKMREDTIEGEEEKGIIICDTQEQLDAALKKKCQEQFQAGIDKPKITISVKMAMLQNTTEYQDYKILETISLGDTVHCKHAELGIVTDARVIELSYDSVLDRIEAVAIGEAAYDYFNGLSDAATRIEVAIRPDGTVIGQQVQGIINMAATQMKLQNTKAKKMNVRAILLEDKDPDSPLFGAMCIGTQGLQIANKRTADGRDWAWSTFGNANGFFADLIVAGTMLYDRCRGGTAEIGGINNTSGVLKILDVKGEEIGRWDKDGVKIYSGEINGPMIIAGGTGGAAGLIKILNESGKLIGSWGKDGMNVHSGGKLMSQNYEEGKQGFKLDLNNGIIEAMQLLIETAKDGRIERGFRFKGGNLEILGTNGEVAASIHCCWSCPDGSGGVPSGWTDHVAFTAGEAVDNYFGGFWVANEDKKRCGAHATDIEFKADKNLKISALKTTINNKEAKTGRAEFSDGTYLEFVNGYLVGGNAKAGGF